MRCRRRSFRSCARGRVRGRRARCAPRTSSAATRCSSTAGSTSAASRSAPGSRRWLRVALTVAGARQRDGYAVLVGCAFSVMAALLCLHGLATPYVVRRRRRRRRIHRRRHASGRRRDSRARRALGASPARRLYGRCSGCSASAWSSSSGSGSRRSSEPGLVPSVPEPRSAAAWIAPRGGACRSTRFSSGARCARSGSRSGVPTSSSPSGSSGSPLRFRLLSCSTTGTSAGGSVTPSRSSGSRPWASPSRTTCAAASRVAPAARRPPRRGPRRGGRGVPRIAHPRAPRRARREGRVHGRAHAPRRAARGAGRGRARARARAASRPRDRRSPARHRQAQVPDAILKKPGPLTDAEFARRDGARRIRASRCSASSEASRTRCIGSSAAITSGSTDRAIRAPSGAIRSPWTSASWPSATSTTRSSRSACTAPAWTHERALEHLRDRCGQAVLRVVRRGAGGRARARAARRPRRRRSSAPSRACRGDTRGRAAGRSGRRRRARRSPPA